MRSNAGEPARPPRAWRRPAAERAPGAYAARPWLAHYPPGVPADLDVPLVPLTQLLDDSAEAYPDRTALAYLGAQVSYRELRQQVDRFATALSGLGVAPGDRVAVILPNCPQHVVALFAVLRLGAVVVEHNPLYTSPELRHQLADSGAKVAVCLDRVYPTLAGVLAETAVEHVVVTSLADYLPAVARLRLRLPLPRSRKARREVLSPVHAGAGVQHFAALLRRAAGPAPQADFDPVTTLALLQYTGGTTGTARGAMLTHTNLVSNAHMNRLWDPAARPGEEVTLGVLPLFHAYGLTVALTSTILTGGTLVLMPRFDVDQVFAAMDRWRPTSFPGVPPLYRAISDSPSSSGTISARCGSASPVR